VQQLPGAGHGPRAAEAGPVLPASLAGVSAASIGSVFWVATTARSARSPVPKPRVAGGLSSTANKPPITKATASTPSPVDTIPTPRRLLHSRSQFRLLFCVDMVRPRKSKIPHPCPRLDVPLTGRKARPSQALRNVSRTAAFTNASSLVCECQCDSTLQTLLFPRATRREYRQDPPSECAL